ncbi:Uncharacterised protein [Shigella sonnei]|nr:Uncharacterised protein [Shigella sonnei]
MRAARYGQPPGNQRRGIFRPAGHNGNAIEIDVIARDDFLLAGRTTQPLCRHVQYLLKLRQFIKQVAETFWRLGLFQKRQ